MGRMALWDLWLWAAACARYGRYPGDRGQGAGGTQGQSMSVTSPVIMTVTPSDVYIVLFFFFSAAFSYVLKGAGTSGTYAENRKALDRWKLVPRMLNDVGERHLEVSVPKVCCRAMVFS